MARNLQEATRVAEATASAETFYRVTGNFLYYPPLVKAKELIESGVIGDPNMVRMRVVVTSVEAESVRLPLAPDALTWRRDPVLNPGGLLYDEAAHKFATAMWWVGEPATVSATVTRTDDYMVDAPSVVVWRFKDANCLASSNTPAPPKCASAPPTTPSTTSSKSRAPGA